MLILDEKNIRDAFVNASRKELTELTLPELGDFERLDYLGWTDRKLPRRSYVVVPVDGEPVGLVLQQAGTAPRTRAQCSWCRDVKLPNDVVFFAARKAGAAGRKGDTVGTLICAEFQCSANVRKAPPMAYIGFDVEAARLERIASLQAHAAGFAAAVLG
ncbi:FBP domain-containing protein [Microbacteriaceae bacterium VKM Ac-2854]|nr:FBP domain-containing protein [Microbacteriaceae bacterium VKM Ac-2854]